MLHCWFLKNVTHLILFNQRFHCNKKVLFYNCPDRRRLLRKASSDKKTYFYGDIMASFFHSIIHVSKTEDRLAEKPNPYKYWLSLGVENLLRTPKHSVTKVRLFMMFKNQYIYLLKCTDPWMFSWCFFLQFFFLTTWI